MQTLALDLVLTQLLLFCLYLDEDTKMYFTHFDFLSNFSYFSYAINFFGWAPLITGLVTPVYLKYQESRQKYGIICVLCSADSG